MLKAWLIKFNSSAFFYCQTKKDWNKINYKSRATVNVNTFSTIDGINSNIEWNSVTHCIYSESKTFKTFWISCAIFKKKIE